MNKLLIVIGLFFCFSCSEKQTESTQKSQNEMPNDTFKISGQVTLKQYKGEGGNLVTEEENNYFETVDNKDVLLQIQLKTVHSLLKDKPDYRLHVKKFKSTAEKYDKLMWELNTTGQKPLGIWGVFKKYFKTVDAGCCSMEDGYRLYQLESGKEFLSYTGELEYTHFPTWNYTGYQASSSTTFDAHSPADVIGNLYYIEMDANTDKADLTRYDVYCTSCMDDVRFEHTPEFEIKPKAQLRNEGLFKQYTLYKEGESITQLDTADYYLVVEYDPKLKVLIPVAEKGLVVHGQLSTDKNLSKGLRIKSR